MPKPHSTLPRYTPGSTGKDPPPSGTPEHEEWLTDVSIEQTFPASDPPSTMDPGNTLSRNDTPQEHRRKK
jgi:hypothetical protein